MGSERALKLKAAAPRRSAAVTAPTSMVDQVPLASATMAPGSNGLAAIAATAGTAPTLETALSGVEHARSPLPHLDRIQAAFGAHDVRDVRAAVGGDGAAAAAAIGARAYAVGERVAFQSAPSLHLAAHEAAHIVQQRGRASLPGGVDRPGDRDEQHADAVARAVVAGKSVEQLLGVARKSTKAPGTTVQRDTGPAYFSKAAPMGPAVQADPEFASRETPAAGDIDAKAYVAKNGTPVSVWTGQVLHSVPFTSPVPAITLGEKFVFAVLQLDNVAVTNNGADMAARLWPLLERVLVPDSLTDIVNHGRDCYPNPLGPSEFTRGVPNEIARALGRRIVESLARIAPRWAHVANQIAFAVEPFSLLSLRAPLAGEVVVSHPIDPVVVNALNQTATFDVERYRNDNPSERMPAPLASRPPLTLGDLEFADEGDNGANGLVHLLRYRTATREDVARLLTGSDENAWQIQAMGPYFRVPPALFTPDVAQAWQVSRGTAQGFGTLARVSADDLALASAHDIKPTDQGGADLTQLVLERMAQSIRHLQEMASLLANPGHDDLMALAQRILARGNAIKIGLDDPMRWDPQTQGQVEILSKTLDGFRACFLMRDAVASWPRGVAAVTHMIDNYVASAAASDTVSVGYEALAYADRQLAASELDLADMTLADMRQHLTDSAPLRGSGEPPSVFSSLRWGSDANWGPFLSKTENAKATREEIDLRARLAALRIQVDQDPKAAAPLIANLRKDITGFGTGVEMIYDFDLMDQAWNALVQETNVQVGVYSGTTYQSVDLANDINDFAQTWKPIYWAWKKDHKVGADQLAQKRPILEAKLKNIVKFFDDAATINKWVGFAFLIGIMLVSGGIGGFVEAGVGEGTLLGFGAGTLAEWTSFTLISNQLFSPDHSLGELWKEFGDNAKLFAALKVFSMIYVGIVGEAAVKGLGVGKAGLMLGQYIIMNAKALTDANSAKQAAGKGSLTGYEIFQISLENVAFMVASEATMKWGGGDAFLEGMRKTGRQLKEVNDAYAMWKSLQQRADQLRANRVTLDALRAMLDEQRMYLELREKALQKLASLSDAEAAAIGFDKSTLPGLIATQSEQQKTLAQNQMLASLEPGGPNELYCPSEHLEAAIAFYSAQAGTKVNVSDPDPLTGDRTVEVTPPDAVPPGGTTPQPQTPFKIIEKQSIGAPVAKPPELSRDTPANVALQTDLTIPIIGDRPPPTPLEAARFADWLPQATLHPDPVLNGLYRARLRDYYMNDPNAALELAVQRYGYPGMSFGDAPFPAPDPNATAAPMSDAQRAFAHYQAELARTGSAFAGDKPFTQADFDTMYASGLEYDPVIERWFARPGATSAGATGNIPPSGIGGVTHIVGEVSSEAVGQQVMRLLASGEPNALRALGVEPPPGFDPRTNEWGLGIQNGKYVIIRGGAGEVDWEALPGVEPLAHSHPLRDPRTGAERRLSGRDGLGVINLADLSTANQLDLVYLLPSTSDLRFVALAGKPHTVHTPYVYLGDGKIASPTPGDTRPTLDIQIDVARVAGQLGGPGSQLVTFTGQVRFLVGGEEVAPAQQIHQTYHPHVGDMPGVGEPAVTPLAPDHPLAKYGLVAPETTGMGLMVTLGFVSPEAVRGLAALELPIPTQLALLDSASAGALNSVVVEALSGRVTGLDGWIARVGAQGDLRFLGDEMQRAHYLLSSSDDPVTFENGYLSPSARASYNAAASGEGMAVAPEPPSVFRLGGQKGQGPVDLAHYIQEKRLATLPDGTPQRVPLTVFIEGAWQNFLGGMDRKGAELVYALRDAKTGEILKIGSTKGQNLVDRIGKYELAGSEQYSGRSLAIDILEVKPPKGEKTSGAIESPLRRLVEADLVAESRPGMRASEVLRWDNTDQRLERPGPGTPGVTNRDMRKSGKYWKGETIMDPNKGAPPKPPPKRPTRDLLVRMIDRHRGDVAALAKELDVNPSTVYRWLEKDDIDPAAYRRPPRHE